MRRSETLTLGAFGVSVVGWFLLTASSSLAQISSAEKYPELGRIDRSLAQARNSRVRSLDVISRIDRLAVAVSHLIDDCATPSQWEMRRRNDIKERLGKLGFSIGQITEKPDGFLAVHITGFNPKSKLVRQTRSFVPIWVRIKHVDIITCIVAEDLADNGYTGYEVDRNVNENTAISSMRTLVSSQSMYYQDGEAPEKIPWFGDRLLAHLFQLPLIDDVLGLGVSCSPHADRARTLSESARNTGEFLERLLAEMDRMQDWIRVRCREGALPDEGKLQLRRNLDSLKGKAAQGRDWIDQLIEEMEATRKRYVDCCDRRL